MTQIPIITVAVASRILAQGELVADHGDGTATVDAGGKEATGKIVRRTHKVGGA